MRKGVFEMLWTTKELEEKVIKLEEENLRLRKENLELKEKLNPQFSNSVIEKIKWLKGQGYGLMESKTALEKVGGDPLKAMHYLQISGDAVARKHKDGRRWTDQDYINYVLNYKGEYKWLKDKSQKNS